jgi:pyruvate-ferredoxin/flavodoxin oxidoreductase
VTVSIKPRRRLVLDGNEAVASVAYRLSQVIAIYPITPASNMGEHADAWTAEAKQNVWEEVPTVVEMQSEAGAAAAVHGALQGGSLATTFTASQGLLLMLPEMFKIAGELLPCVIHVAARTVATHALSIFGDHSDVMACRSAGFAMLCSGSVQEAQDLACIAHMATVESRIPFLHFFDGFRTSHELANVVPLGDEELRELVDPEMIAAHRARALSPDHPVVRGTAQNPDAFFQAREAANPYYLECPGIVERAMERFARLTGRRYRPFEYEGHPDAERVIVIMGSGAETAAETARHLARKGERVAVVRVRLFRPFSSQAIASLLPASVRRIAVLDRTKEPGALGEPLLSDVVLALAEERPHNMPRVIGGRYGLSSKEFTPGMVKAIFDELSLAEPHRRFTVGIVDDVTGLSLPASQEFDVLDDDIVNAVFWGLGSDGTVGANKSSIKIIGEDAGREVQGYFVYDSKKSGAVTISHLRFGQSPIHAPYLITQADFVACHQFYFMERYDVLEHAKPGATFLLNSPFGPEEVWDHLPREVQEIIDQRKLAFFVVDADRVARESGLGRRINTVMQACFFLISKVLPVEQANACIRERIEKTYSRQGPEVVAKNLAALNAARLGLRQVPVRKPNGAAARPEPNGAGSDFVQRVTRALLAGKGDLLPVSAFPVDGTWPVGTARYEKRNLALEIPVWESDLCIQCNKCAFVCPHSAIRAKVYDPAELAKAPPGFPSLGWKSGRFAGSAYTVQVAPEDCTGCGVCVVVCPVRDKQDPSRTGLVMRDQMPLRDQERERYEFFLSLPEADRKKVHFDVKESQLLQPLFEYSGACAGCGETPYIKLVTQLFGDRAIIANATGCSSIFGGNLPTTPYSANRDGRGPAWANSLFEDNAEFGFGLRLSVDAQTEAARDLLRRHAAIVGDELVTALLDADQSDETGIAAQRERVVELRARLAECPDPGTRTLAALADYLVKKSVWLIGGDGWAYDIGFGGLDHVLAQNRNVNVLVLDTEVYSNTGGQQSKATPLGASAKFAVSGKATGKKDLGLMAMMYGHAYVARIAFGAKDAQTVRALVEADAHPGPSIVIAYSHCVAHGYDLVNGTRQQKAAVDSGAWPLYRFDPKRVALGQPRLVLDSSAPKAPLMDYLQAEGRFASIARSDPERFAELTTAAELELRQRELLYRHLAALVVPER